MNGPTDVVRAWKDAGYRASLDAAARDALPPNPAGDIDLSELDLDGVNGGAAMSTEHILTLGCCDGFTSDPDFCSFGCGPYPTTTQSPGCTHT